MGQWQYFIKIFPVLGIIWFLISVLIISLICFCGMYGHCFGTPSCNGLWIFISNCVQISMEMRILGLIFSAIFWVFGSLEGASSHGDQPLSRIAIDRALVALDNGAYVKASPLVLGSTVSFQCLLIVIFIHWSLYSLGDAEIRSLTSWIPLQVLVLKRNKNETLSYQG